MEKYINFVGVFNAEFLQMIINDPNGIIGNLEINTLPGADNIANYLSSPFRFGVL